MSNSIYSNSNVAAENQLVTWINEAGLVEGRKRADLLRKIIEVLVHQCSHLIHTYSDNILSYVNDKSNEVKKQVIVFIEEASQKQTRLLTQCAGALRGMQGEGAGGGGEAIAVTKRSIQAACLLYRQVLRWITTAASPATSSAVLDDMRTAWEHVNQLKLQILNMIDSENEGIRTNSIKFLEQVLLLQMSPDEANDADGAGGAGGEAPEGGAGIAGEEYLLDRLPRLSFIQKKALEEEAEHIFSLLVQFHNSQHISSVNLMACMTSLCEVSRRRPRLLSRVVRALAALHHTLPPTLSQSQVNSVRKHLKVQVLTVMRSAACTAELQAPLTQLLLDAGMTSQELHRALPRDRRLKRVSAAAAALSAAAKRARLESPQPGSDSNSRSDTPPAPVPAPLPLPLLVEALGDVARVATLVLDTLQHRTPDEMPPEFPRLYAPIPDAGSRAQVAALAHMLHRHLRGEAPVQPAPSPPPAPTAPVPAPAPAPAPPSLSDIAARIPLLKAEEDDEEERTTSLRMAVAKLQESSRPAPAPAPAPPAAPVHVPPPSPAPAKLKQRVKLLKLQEITRPIPKEVKERMIVSCVERILAAEEAAAAGGVASTRCKLLALLAGAGGGPGGQPGEGGGAGGAVLRHVAAAPAARLGLGLRWLYEEYAVMQGCSRAALAPPPTSSTPRSRHDHAYNRLLCSLATYVADAPDTTDTIKEQLLRKLYLEAPVITADAVELLQELVSHGGGDRVAGGAAGGGGVARGVLQLLVELCVTRPSHAHKYVPALLYHTISPVEWVRSEAVSLCGMLYSSEGGTACRRAILKHSALVLGYLQLDTPPPALPASPLWTDELYRACLALPVQLLALDEDQLLELSRAYSGAPAEAKRCILRAAEAPLRGLVEAWGGQGGEALHLLLEECPRGAEPLLTRVLHILTEKAPPSRDLVSRVRDVYERRPDVRLLVPVITGLTHTEIVSALPRLLRLPAGALRDVIHRLLGIPTTSDSDIRTHHSTPISPLELLVALHLVDPATSDLKNIIKATALCFAEKHIYTQEVLCEVITRLSREPQIPVLLLRSVLQALTLYPSLAPRLLDVLAHLQEKEVWNDKVAWEGWVKCCVRLLPAGATLLPRLPPAPLAAALAAAPPLRAALQSHISFLPASACALLPPHVLHEAAAPPTASPAAPSAVPPPAPVPAPAPTIMDYQMESSYLPPPGAPPLEPLPPGME